MHNVVLIAPAKETLVVRRVASRTPSELLPPVASFFLLWCRTTMDWCMCSFRLRSPRGMGASPSSCLMVRGLPRLGWCTDSLTTVRLEWPSLTTACNPSSWQPACETAAMAGTRKDFGCLLCLPKNTLQLKTPEVLKIPI